MFANNPVYGWQTFGEHTMLFNAMLFWNYIPVPETGTRPATTSGQ